SADPYLRHENRRRRDPIAATVVLERASTDRDPLRNGPARDRHEPVAWREWIPARQGEDRFRWSRLCAQATGPSAPRQVRRSQTAVFDRAASRGRARLAPAPARIDRGWKNSRASFPPPHRDFRDT